MLMMILVVSPIFVINLIEGEHIAKMKGIRLYNADYIKKYGNTLNVMFDNQWTLKSVEKKYNDPDEICEHVDTRPQKYLEWTIEYHDGDGKLRTFVFDNRQSLSSQIEDYIEQYIAEYYQENFFDIYLKDVPLAPSSYVFGSIVRASVNPHLKENREWRRKTEEYRRLLETPRGTVCLSKLTPANVFEICPIYLSINVSLSEYSDDDKQSFEENIKKKVADLAEALNKFTKDHLNAEISLGYQDIIYLHDGERKWYFAFIQGKQASNKAGLYFERYVFDSYRGVFW